MHGEFFVLAGGLVLGESSMVASGFSYANENGKERFDVFKTMNLRPFYTSLTASEMTTHWNVQIHYFLKYYVMLKTIDRSKEKHVKQIMPVLAAFVASSFWHGTYPGFSVLFIALFVLDLIG